MTSSVSASPIVVLEPEIQSIVPPVASVVAVIEVELPPVSPPVHPLTVMVLAALPVMLVHVISLGVQRYSSAFSAVIAPLVETHTEPAPVAGSSMPSPVSAVTLNANPKGGLRWRCSLAA